MEIVLEIVLRFLVKVKLKAVMAMASSCLRQLISQYLAT